MTRKVQFAVVREDYLVEAKLIDMFCRNNILLVASGGCTALNLQTLYPDVKVNLFDINADQLSHVQDKIAALQANAIAEIKRDFNVGCASPNGKNACGNFEKLFRSIQYFVQEFILTDDQIMHLLTKNDELATEYLGLLFSNPYWDIMFELFFSDTLLQAMFGPDAIQYAKPGSYPKYFKAKIVSGLLRDDRITNYFLHHIFLGCYVDRVDSLPPYLQQSSKIKPITMYNSTIGALESLNTYDLISLSNIFDWSSKTQIREAFSILAKKLKPGTIVLYRQLNNSNDYGEFYAKNFALLPSLGQELLAVDRSLFYENIVVLEKI